jgi:pilus assembly protein TadC
VVPGPDWLIWFAGAVFAVLGAVALGWLTPRSTARRRQQLILQAPQALELMGSCLDAGMPVRQACRAIVDAFDGPIADDLGRVVALVELGASDAAAWRSLHDHPQLGPAADDLARSVESGTMLVEGLRRHAADARQARQGALQVRARAVGVRSVLPLMVCFIPSFLLLGVVPTVISAVSSAFL